MFRITVIRQNFHILCLHMYFMVVFYLESFISPLFFSLESICQKYNHVNRRKLVLCSIHSIFYVESISISPAEFTNSLPLLLCLCIFGLLVLLKYLIQWHPSLCFALHLLLLIIIFSGYTPIYCGIHKFVSYIVSLSFCIASILNYCLCFRCKTITTQI